MNLHTELDKLEERFIEKAGSIREILLAGYKLGTEHAIELMHEAAEAKGEVEK